VAAAGAASTVATARPIADAVLTGSTAWKRGPMPA